jgi:hypothetical protein
MQAMLNQYTLDVQDLLNDKMGQFFPQATLNRYINKARRRVAYASGCLRAMPAGTKTYPLQEVYKFSDWLPQVQSQLPGIESILGVLSLAVSIGVGGWKPMWRRLVFSDFQARYRIWNGTFYGTVSEPGWYAQYGVGPAGKLYLAPIPSQSNPMDVDLELIPAPLLTDDDPEPIPQPWVDAVPYFAAFLCLVQQQRPQDAQAMMQLLVVDLPFCAAVVNKRMLQTPYGATLRSA